MRDVSWKNNVTLKINQRNFESFVNEWKENISSPAVAAASGEIDDIISVNEMRLRICSALQMLALKGKVSPSPRKVLPL